MKKKLRIYVDSSVIGGCLDKEFEMESNRLIEAAKAGKFTFVISELVSKEIGRAPKSVRQVIKSIPADVIEALYESPPILELARAYVADKVIGPHSLNDAIHVAYATIARVDAIVSWNFHDLVRLDRIKGYNQVNFANGYGLIQIVSPKEVLFDDEEK